MKPVFSSSNDDMKSIIVLRLPQILLLMRNRYLTKNIVRYLHLLMNIYAVRERNAKILRSFELLFPNTDLNIGWMKIKNSYLMGLFSFSLVLLLRFLCASSSLTFPFHPFFVNLHCEHFVRTWDAYKTTEDTSKVVHSISDLSWVLIPWI